MLPLLLLIAVMSLQLGIYLWAITDVNDAARQGARAQSLGRDGCGTARRVVADSLDVLSCSAHGGSGPRNPTRLAVRVKVPVIHVVDRFLPRVTIARAVDLP